MPAQSDSGPDKQQDMAQLQPGVAAAAAPQQKPFRVRTITAFLNLPADSIKWETEVEFAGRFLQYAQQQLESLGYEVQTVRIATQPFPEYLCGGSSSSNSSSSNDSANSSLQQLPQALDDVMVTNAVLLETLAARHGIPLVSLGSSSNPQHLRVIPMIITATSSTSCTFALPQELDWGLAYQVAEVIMDIAAETGGMGNFRFGSASNMRAGIPYFPVACCSPQQHMTFAIGTEADALLHQAFATAAAAAAAAAAGNAEDRQQQQQGQQQQCYDVLQSARQELHRVLLDHFAPLEAAAMQIEQDYPLHATQTTAPTASGAELTAAAQTGHAAAAMGTSDDSSSSSSNSGSFTYLGLDTSLAPGLDTPALTDSYALLLQQLHAQRQAGSTAQHAAARGSSHQGAPQGAREGHSVTLFGSPGSVTVSSMVTQVLKGLPLKLTGYCGLMLAVCEDQGLAATAAAGSITISQLLQYSAVCGCGLDTVPGPGPTLDTPQQQELQQQQQQPQATEGEQGLQEAEQDGQAGCCSAVRSAQDAATTATIAGLVADVNTLAYRLDKPLACRLLPLPGKLPGDPTGFDHPYMINSRVMDLNR